MLSGLRGKCSNWVEILLPSLAERNTGGGANAKHLIWVESGRIIDFSPMSRSRDIKTATPAPKE